jgi:hypothetical protein
LIRPAEDHFGTLSAAHASHSTNGLVMTENFCN